MQVYISSGAHLHTDHSRDAQVADNVDEVDIIFSEASANRSWREKLLWTVRLFPIAPLVALAAFIQFHIVIDGVSWAMTIVTDSGGDDTDLIARLEEVYDAEICEIDVDGVGTHIRMSPFVVGVVNWIGVVGLYVTVWPDMVSLPSTYYLISRVVLVSYGLFFALIVAVNSSRENNMVASIAAHKDTSDSGVAVIGKAHHIGVASQLQAIDGVSVLNPEPQHLSLSTKFLVYLFRVRRQLPV